jgi:NMD protein affecting ribosome stability and mRNA decay
MSAVLKPFQHGRGDQFPDERGSDSYSLRGKLLQPAVCPTCGAVYHEGRWQWLPRPPGAREVLCAACHRIADDEPAGYVNIEGELTAAKRAEMLSLLRHHEERAKAEHPMERIAAIRQEDGRTVVTTTDLHLARDLGRALESAFHGTLELKYNDRERMIRATWRR